MKQSDYSAKEIEKVFQVEVKPDAVRYTQMDVDTHDPWFPDIKNSEWVAQKNNILTIQNRVAERCKLGRDWYARQIDPRTNQWIGVTFIVGDKSIFLPNEEVMHSPDDTAFIDQLATGVMGYAPDSAAHVERLMNELDIEIESVNTQIGNLKRQQRDYRTKRHQLHHKLKQLRRVKPQEYE